MVSVIGVLAVRLNHIKVPTFTSFWLTNAIPYRLTTRSSKGCKNRKQYHLNRIRLAIRTGKITWRHKLLHNCRRKRRLG